MWSKNKHILTLIIPFLFMFGCQSESSPIEKDQMGNELFGAFYEHFYTDSIFQLSRIEFPILRNQRSMGNDSPYWEMENWQYLKKVNLDDEKIERFLYDLDGLVEENIIISKKFRIKNTYSLIDQQWFLTSYSGMIDLGSSR